MTRIRSRATRSRWLAAPIAAALLLAATIGLLAQAQPAAAANATIGAGGSGTTARFAPNVATVNTGDVVTFNYTSGGAHTATAVNGAFNVSVTTATPSGAWTAGAAGTYYFYCALHADASQATEAHVVANDAMVGKIVVQATGSATSTATPAPVADMTLFGFPTVAASMFIPAGQGATLNAGNQTVVIDPGMFATDVTFELLTGNPATFASFVPAGDRVIATFAWRVTGPNGRIGSFGGKAVHWRLTSSDVTANSQVYNVSPTSPLTAARNSAPPAVSGQIASKDFTAATLGWFATAGSAAVTPAKTGNAGLVDPSRHTTAMAGLALASLALIGGARLATKRAATRRDR